MNGNEESLYDMLDSFIDEDMQQGDFGDSKLEEDTSLKEEIKDRIKYRFAESITKILFRSSFILTSLIFLFFYVRYIQIFSLYNKPSAEKFYNIFFLVFSFAPMALWFFSTMDYYFEGYLPRKKFYFVGYSFISIASLSTIYFNFISDIMKVFVNLIPTERSITKGSIVISYIFGLVLLYAIPLLLVFRKILKSFNDDIFLQWFNSFGYYSFFKKKKKNAQFSYTMSVITNITTCKKYIVSQVDRFIHFLVVGATGSGKTSSVVTPTFSNDLDQKIENTDRQKEQIHKMCEEGKIGLTKHIKDFEFNVNDFDILPEYRNDKKVIEQFESLKEKYPQVGYTVFCPNSSFTDELYNIAIKKGFKVNRIDPVSDEKTHVHPKGYIGMNPVYIERLEGEPDKYYIKRVFEIAKNAADVNQAVYDLNGFSDTYFASLNKSVYIAAAVVVIIGIPLLHPGVFATPADIQGVLDNFEKIKPYRDALVKKWGIKNSLGKTSLDIGTARVYPLLQPIIDRIDNDLLGSNANEMKKQIVGLRNVILETLINPDVREIFCSKNSIDFNKALRNSEITLINFEISMGAASVNFGLSVLLNLILAVFSRPLKQSKSAPHFIIMDEAAELLHPKLGKCVAMFRQYSVGMMFMFQSLAQFDSLQSTAHLADVFTSNCGHCILMGRASERDMRYFNYIGGTYKKVEESSGKRSGSLLDEKASKQFSSNEEVTETDNVTGTETRYRKFQECTVLGVQDGTAIVPFFGKLDFLPKSDQVKRHRLRYSDWDRYLIVPSSEESPEIIESSISSKTYFSVSGSEGEAKPSEEWKKNINSETVVSASDASLDEEEEMPLFANLGTAETNKAEEPPKKQEREEEISEEEEEIFPF